MLILTLATTGYSAGLGGVNGLGTVTIDIRDGGCVRDRFSTPLTLEIQGSKSIVYRRMAALGKVQIHLVQGYYSARVYNKITCPLTARRFSLLADRTRDITLFTDSASKPAGSVRIKFDADSLQAGGVAGMLLKAHSPEIDGSKSPTAPYIQSNTYYFDVVPVGDRTITLVRVGKKVTRRVRVMPHHLSVVNF